ncbi:hypothetical protein DL771_011357 [Monosporascus sp. 5C6A]|nr:hypothetical protein DL771_011357 [Monosporascus sp. 5C6A]
MLSTTRTVSIDARASAHPPKNSPSSRSSASRTPARTAFRNFRSSIRYPRYRSASPPSSYIIRAVPPSLRRYPLPYDIQRIIVLNGVFDPSASYRRYSSLNRLTTSTSISSKSSGLSG